MSIAHLESVISYVNSSFQVTHSAILAAMSIILIVEDATDMDALQMIKKHLMEINAIAY